MVNNYIEITDQGLILEERWQDKKLIGLSYQELLRKKREIGNVIKVKWFENNSERTIFLEEPLLSRSISNDRKYISVVIRSGIFIFSDNGELLSTIKYPIFHEGIIINSGKINSQRIVDGDLIFTILTENQDFYIIYSIKNEIFINIEQCR